MTQRNPSPKAELLVLNEKLIEERGYWLDRLESMPESATLPLTNPHATDQLANEWSETTFKISDSTYDRLANLTAQGPFLLYTTLLAALKICLYKYTGITRIAVGSPIRKGEGRSSTDNALVIIDQLNATMTFRQLLMAIRTTLLEAYAHQQYPFERLIRDLGYEHQSAALFRVSLALEEIHHPMPDIGQDIQIHIAKASDHLVATLRYAAKVIDESMVASFVNHYLTLLDQALTDTNAPIGSLSMASAAEQQRVLYAWQGAKQQLGNESVLTLFARQVEQRPQATAVRFATEELSYALLEARSNQIAHYLKALGVGAEVRVGLCMERSPWMICAILGIMKAGGAYVPLDPRYPTERLNLMIEDAEPTVLLTMSELAEHVPSAKIHPIYLDRAIPELSDYPVSAPPLSYHPEQLAYIIYTSGSTGAPKGVLVPQRGLVNLVLAQIELFAIDHTSRLLQFAPLSFDASVSEIWTALLAGAELVMAAWETMVPGLELIELLERAKITTITLPPSILAALPDADLPDLQTLVVAGEPCPAYLVDRWGQQRRMLNAYGPTENTVCATAGSCDSGPRQPAIGSALPNVQVYLLNHQLQPVAVGIPGMLYIGGMGLSRGYHQNPRLTAERFIPDLWGGTPGARLYNTGDIARFRPDGQLEYIGRSDQQVKLRGYRIELGEIEAVLQQHPAVQTSVLALHTNQAQQQHLVAYVVAKSAVTLTITELQQHCNRLLPNYMLPTIFMLLPELPHTPNGKIDRQSLPIPEQVRPGLVKDFVAPRSETETILAQIWADILNIDHVGIEHNFFELGGHSLLATQVLSRVREICKVDVPLRNFFRVPTIAALANIVDTSETVSKVPALRVLAERHKLPLSFAQQRLWAIEQLHPGESIYNIPGALQLDGQLEPAGLEYALNEIVRRHEVLRTTFALSDEGPIQRIAADLHITIPLRDLESNAAQEQAVLDQLLQTEAALPFDLNHGPLLRAQLIRLAPERHLLLFTLHHIIADGWSLGILTNEFATLYTAFIEQRPSPLPDLAIQYADFAAWQRQWLQGSILADKLNYWKQQLANAPTRTTFPPDRPRPAIQSYTGATLVQQLSPALTSALLDLSRQFDVSLFMALSGGFAILLNRYVNSNDLVIGTDVANRQYLEVEPLIGFFVNVLPLRFDLGGNPSFAELAARIRVTALDAFTHQDVPFEKIVDELKLPRNLEHNPLVQVLFVLQNAPAPPLELPGLTIQPLFTDTQTAKFDLFVSVQEKAAELQVFWNYNSDLFDRATIEAMSTQFDLLLQRIVTNPTMRLNKLGIDLSQEKETQHMQPSDRKEQRRKTFTSVKPKVVSTPVESLIKTSYLTPDQPLPLIIEPAVSDVDLIEWAQANRTWIEQELHTHGAILFRGFGVNDVDTFERVAQSVTDELFGEYGDLPREGLGGKVYTSTPYPADKAILFHNESSHLHRWPMKQWFYCVKAAQQGGETPLADCRKVYAALSPELRERFAQKQLMYVRNFTDGLDVRWQDFYGTDDRSIVEEYCRETEVECQWQPGNNLRTRQIRMAVAQHPETAETIFFNQIPVHHIACLDEAARASLQALYREEDLPRNVYYGDGTPIEDEVVEQVLAAYEQVAVRFPWQEGDIILLDNMLVAHARDPFVGPRKIVVAMGDMITAEGLDRARHNIQ